MRVSCKNLEADYVRVYLCCLWVTVPLCNMLPG